MSCCYFSLACEAGEGICEEGFRCVSRISKFGARPSLELEHISSYIHTLVLMVFVVRHWPLGTNRCWKGGDSCLAQSSDAIVRYTGHSASRNLQFLRQMLKAQRQFMNGDARFKASDSQSWSAVQILQLIQWRGI